MKRTKLVAFGLTLVLTIAPHVAVAQGLDELLQQGNSLQEAMGFCRQAIAQLRFIFE